MERKEMFCAVIGGIVGAVLTMTAGSFAPLGAQNGVKDAEFGTITCSGIMVRDKALPGRSVIVGTSGVVVTGDVGEGLITLGTGQSSAGISVSGESDGGTVTMSADEDGGYVSVRGNAGGGAEMKTDEHGGYVFVYGKGSGDARAAMGVTEYGSGAVSTWDKNGYRLANLK